MSWFSIAVAFVAVPSALAQDAEQPISRPQQTESTAKRKIPVRAKPIPPVDWVTPRDFPNEAAGTNLEVGVRIDVDTTGKVVGCTVIKSSGSSFHDRKTCDLVSARGRYEIARSADGRAIPSASFLRFRITG
ncbi:energy transducer TonB [Sphingomonas sp. MS122]|uniref:energy transducer TonB n=1 Tax=Sphingomonas sp. MS122 TaxID=3412683 RepID=UPI003C2AF60D